VYVTNLARDLQGLGVDAMVAAPSENKSLLYDRWSVVRRYAVSDKVTDVVQLYGPGDLQAATEFAKIFSMRRCQTWCDLHAFTRGVSLRLVHAAKKRGIPVVFTYHTPT